MVAVWPTPRLKVVLLRVTVGGVLSSTTIATLSESVSTPPLPVLPRSEVVNISVSVPLNPIAGLYTKPANAAFTALSTPVKIMSASPTPSPTLKLRSVVVDRLKKPCDTPRVISTSPLPASTSETNSRLPFETLNSRSVPSTILWDSGILLTGPSLIAFKASVPPLSWEFWKLLRSK